MNELEFVTKHRRHLHQHPELSLHEFETTAYIKAFLDSLNIKYDCPLETGVIAYLEGNGSHTIAYRADIDALPILEENDVPYRSQSDHVMHACGHDGHTTALMLFVQRCKDMQDAGQLPQNVVFIFQPAEEITASATEYRFFLTGLSSHVADKEQGHSCGEALQHVLTQISQIQQFHLNGLKRNIVHIGHFKAGEAINTVPSNGYLEGTIRTYDIDDLTIVKNQMHKIAESVKLLFNVDCEVKFAEGYPPTINSPKLRTQIEDALIKADLNVYDKPTPFLFGEDFSFYGQQLAPAYFVFIGTRNEDKGFVTGLHTSHLNFDEKVLINVVNFYENLLNNYKEV